MKNKWLSWSAAILLLPALALAKKPPSLNLSADNPYFSPNKDGMYDVLVFQVKSERIKSVISWEFQVKDSAGAIKRSVSGLKTVPGIVSWNGLDDFGATVPEGKYETSLIVWDTKLGAVPAEPVAVTVDVTPPTLSFSAQSKRVALADGKVQPIGFDLSAVDLSGIKDWNLQIKDYGGNVLFVQSSTQPLPNRLSVDPPKNLIPAGRVAALLSVSDRAGNQGNSSPVELEVGGSASAPAHEKFPVRTPEPVSGKVLQLTSIISIADLFGPDAGRDTPLGPQAAVLLTPLASAVQNNPGARAMILGHVDSQPNLQDAKSLSSAFAWKVYSFFVKLKGADKSLVSVKGLGNAVPVAREAAALDKSRNRRIEIQIFFPDSALR